MQSRDRPRPFEYSSLVMGSRDIPSVAFPHRPQLTSKPFPKKPDRKYPSKTRPPKLRTRNERPDIFLEGEQLTANNSAWQQELDFRYFEHLRNPTRKSTPTTATHTQLLLASNHSSARQRSTPNLTDDHRHYPPAAQPQHQKYHSQQRLANNERPSTQGLSAPHHQSVPQHSSTPQR